MIENNCIVYLKYVFLHKQYNYIKQMCDNNFPAVGLRDRVIKPRIKPEHCALSSDSSSNVWSPIVISSDVDMRKEMLSGIPHVTAVETSWKGMDSLLSRSNTELDDILDCHFVGDYAIIEAERSLLSDIPDSEAKSDNECFSLDLKRKSSVPVVIDLTGDSDDESSIHVELDDSGTLLLSKGLLDDDEYANDVYCLSCHGIMGTVMCSTIKKQKLLCSSEPYFICNSCC